ncbi:HAD-IIIC family phosphatase [Streptomyces sp. 3MP-14]|uniref:HAD-IIIC family phosphatase n=2 Tax=Streptomyces TaxID=1883 RepID=A0A5N5ZUY3_9ACTN|nr:HAD-IIIC family phosphatase [Streptomyces mimosae]KAB8172867.1 HAD-IIIC family phosphatase [Streptomyces sp. 3MP-14]
MPATDPAAPAEPFPPSARLRALIDEGRLPAEFPRVASLLAEADDAELLRAGRFLGAVDLDDVLRERPETPTVTVAITGHSTLNALVPAITGQLARHGLLTRPHLCDFDSYVFELSDPDSGLYAADPDLALCVLAPEIVLDELPNPWDVRDLEEVLAAKTRLIEGLVARFTATARGTLVLNTLPLPRALTAQLIALRARAGAAAAWHEANARLLRLAEAHPRVVVLDSAALADACRGDSPAPDPRLSRYAKVHLSPAFLGSLAREVGHLARLVTGRGRKCLVLDLDNTVWGGVLGDDGPEGIEVADTYRGEAFRAFQRLARQIASQGVLLAAVSKNDLEPVQEVLRDHPGMTLREGDFVRVVANWRPKHDNLRELAADLNLGTDAFVFVDDSSYERGLVRRELPEIAVVDVGTEPALHTERLLADGWFDVWELTAEDRKRPTLYREELVRRDFISGFDSLDDYLAELGVTVRLADVAEGDVPRVSQITLRTNQFNLTTRRLQPDDVHTLRRDPAALPLAIHASDRFGDNGLVGAVFLREDGDRMVIDNFLLSCRVFSRGIEQACLSAVLRHARERGATALRGHYVPSPKNGKVAELYPRSGFTALDEAPDERGGTVFEHDLSDIPEPPAHVRLIESLAGAGETHEKGERHP